MNVKLKNLTLYQVFLLNLLFLSKEGPYFVGVGVVRFTPHPLWLRARIMGLAKLRCTLMFLNLLQSLKSNLVSLNHYLVFKVQNFDKKSPLFGDKVFKKSQNGQF